MSSQETSVIERFQVQGNVLKVTPRFDPRFQSRAIMELINIVSSLAEEEKGPEVVLDISAAASIPSMMFGMFCSARDLADKAGKRLKIRFKRDTYRRLQELGLGGIFTPPVNADSEYVELEMAADAVPPVYQEEEEKHGS